MSALGRRLASLEEQALGRAVARFQDYWHQRMAGLDPRDENGFWAMIERAGFHGRTVEALEAWDAVQSAAHRAQFRAVDGAVLAMTQHGGDLVLVRARLAALAPVVELPPTTPPHQVVDAFIAALEATPRDPL